MFLLLEMINLNLTCTCKPLMNAVINEFYSPLQRMLKQWMNYIIIKALTFSILQFFLQQLANQNDHRMIFTF